MCDIQYHVNGGWGLCGHILKFLYCCFRELFNAAFVSCWMELRPIHQEDLVTSLKQALTLQNIPEITQTILNLAEFMEHCEEFTVSGNHLINELDNITLW